MIKYRILKISTTRATLSFRDSGHDVQNFKNKEEWDSIKTGIELH